VERTALFDATGVYRYRLGRVWAPLFPRRCAFLMLNPSTADERIDDPTIRRCIGFAQSWGYGALDILNIFAYRSTDPGVLDRVEDPVGPENDRHIREVVGNPRCELVVAAWGVHGTCRNRNSEVLKILPENTMCLGFTKERHPKHPLYVPGDARLVSLFP